MHRFRIGTLGGLSPYVPTGGDAATVLCELLTISEGSHLHRAGLTHLRSHQYLQKYRQNGVVSRILYRKQLKDVGKINLDVSQQRSCAEAAKLFLKGLLTRAHKIM